MFNCSTWDWTDGNINLLEHKPSSDTWLCIILSHFPGQEMISWWLRHSRTDGTQLEKRHLDFIKARKYTTEICSDIWTAVLHKSDILPKIVGSICPKEGNKLWSRLTLKQKREIVYKIAVKETHLGLQKCTQNILRCLQKLIFSKPCQIIGRKKKEV